MINIFAASIFSPMQVNKLFFFLLLCGFSFTKYQRVNSFFFLGGETKKKYKLSKGCK